VTVRRSLLALAALAGCLPSLDRIPAGDGSGAREPGPREESGVRDWPLLPEQRPEQRLETGRPDARLPGSIVLIAANAPTTGALGGLAGADALCATQAKTAGWAGTFQAFLSSYQQRDVRDLVPAARATWPVVSSKGTPMFASWSSIFGSSVTTWLNSAAVYTFAGVQVTEANGWDDARVWHGTHTDGSSKDTYHCSNWTSGSSGLGASGQLADYRLLDQGAKSCDRAFALLCVRTAP